MIKVLISVYVRIPRNPTSRCWEGFNLDRCGMWAVNLVIETSLSVMSSFNSQWSSWVRFHFTCDIYTSVYGRLREVVGSVNPLWKGRKEGNVLFSDALNTFYLWLYCIRHMVKNHSAARVLLYAPSHRQDNTYHGLCYTSCGVLAGMRNSSMCPPWRIDQTTHRTMSEHSYHGSTSRSLPEDE